MFCGRLELPDELTLETNVECDWDNDTGLCTRVLVDLQRLLGCAKLGDPVKEFFTPTERADFAAVVGGISKYSARLNLLFRTNSQLRTDCRF